jgi:queuosine precursor transporter
LLVGRVLGSTAAMNEAVGTLQLLDSVVFTLVAFAGQMPVLQIMVGQLIAKLIIAVLDTPFIYVGRWLLQQEPVAIPEAAD